MIRLSRLFALPVLLALLAMPASAWADPFASDWSKGQKSAARLIAATLPDRRVRAGIEISLVPGAHTYWRLPGDAGVPPVISFEGSANLAHAEPLFPAPRRLVENELVTYGYEGEVIFPLAVTAMDAGKPVALVVKLDYAACDRICLPVHAVLSLTLQPAGQAGPYAGRLAKALARVPVSRKLGDEGSLAVAAISYEPASPDETGKPMFSIDALVPSTAQSVNLIADATEGWFLQVAPASSVAPGHFRFPITVEERPKAPATAPSEAHFVLVADDSSIEVAVPLDASRLKP